ncbi:RAMP superfamily CRISPR-associated protein [Mangrovihabitans endophyticus]|uniref:CRISPR type III-associated protein domain-containing protein n=1 Tax=Mangrovihabitans endophyticus TaxID=1751298 RepID=A0A8J3FSG8_9ACTN|nr:RAMP superfamily CRISPR-associated protein [Mangrovihabitans endophyticus]GGL19430.1 hypothetical protein GCM10012284_62450 [Mangrovihabitans endophyticus]
MTAPAPVCLHITAHAVQRLALGVASEIGYFTDSHPYVPGSVLRGALAATWIAEHGPPTSHNPRHAEFQELFDGDIRFGPLLPEGTTRAPLSVRLCKYQPYPRCVATAVDDAFDTGTHCPSCTGPLHRSRGTITGPAATTRITRTEIDPATGRAKDGHLYANAALPAGTLLTGVIHGHHPWLAQPHTIWLGGRRTVGGRATVTPVGHTPAQPPRLLPPGQLITDGRLLLRLGSPAVFVDTAGRPTLVPQPGIDLPDGVTVTRAWTRPLTWTGWHAASRLPKPADLCAAAGSTYILDGTSDALTTFAAQVQRHGIGLRRAEGLGTADTATTAWRPRPARTAPTLAHDPGIDLHAAIMELTLTADELRWLTAVVHEMQIEQHRHAGALPESLVADVLDRPAADVLSGRQRHTLLTCLTGADPEALRTLFILLDTAAPEDPSPMERA